MRSDSDSDLSDLEDEFAAGDWTPDTLRDKLFELEEIFEEHKDTRRSTVRFGHFLYGSL